MSTATTLIDLQNDELIPVQQVIKERLGHKVAPATAWRWRLKGVKVAGQCFKLECVRCGCNWLTTREAFARFLQAQTEAATAAHDHTVDGTPERSEDTKRRLQSQGLL